MHGVFVGTDTGRSWMWGTYGFTGLSVLFLVLVRAFSYGYRPPRAVAPTRAGGSPVGTSEASQA